MVEPAVVIKKVAKRYESHIAVRELSLSVPKGSVYGLLGPNGAGKTTTIRMILNIIAPDSGDISILGHSNTDPAITDITGYLPEERGLYRKMQVRRVLRFLGELKGLKGSDIERRIDAWLERLGLRGVGEDWGNAKVDELSRGMQQKVQFIGALLHDPEIIILDEPFSGLDPINAQALKDTVNDLRRKGKTILFSTHVMENAEKMCDSVCIIARGELVLNGKVSDVQDSYGNSLVSIGFASSPPSSVQTILSNPSLVSSFETSTSGIEVELASGTDAPSLLTTLVNSGARINRFESSRPSLHKIFLERVGAMGVEEGVSGHG